jgi:hypothetical protein
MTLTAVTDGYEFRLWPETHRQPPDTAICVDEELDTPGCYKLITLNAGDVVFFSGGLIHSGAAGHGLSLHSYGMPMRSKTELYEADGGNATATYHAKYVTQNELDRSAASPGAGGVYSFFKNTYV